jgi:hypothetical protein
MSRFLLHGQELVGWGPFGKTISDSTANTIDNFPPVLDGLDVLDDLAKLSSDAPASDDSVHVDTLIRKFYAGPWLAALTDFYREAANAFPELDRYMGPKGDPRITPDLGAVNTTSDYVSPSLLLKRQKRRAVAADGNAGIEVDGNTKYFGSSYLTQERYSYIEYDKCMASLSLFGAVVKNKYVLFARPGRNQLPVADFAEMVRVTNGICAEVSTATKRKLPEVHSAMLTFIALNDLGKSRHLGHELVAAGLVDAGELAKIDHDTLLARALGNNKFANAHFPSWKRVDDKLKALFLASVQLDFNPAQFNQGECTPGHLMNLVALQKTAEGRLAAKVYLLHTLFDVAGAAGHLECRFSSVFNNKFGVLKSFLEAMRTVEGIVNPGDIFAAYYGFLLSKMPGLGTLLIQEQATAEVNADIEPRKRSIHEKCALLRIIAMCRAGNVYQRCAAIAMAWDRLDAETREQLSEELGKWTGLGRPGEKPAIMLYYGPKLLASRGGLPQDLTDDNNASFGTWVTNVEFGMMLYSYCLATARARLDAIKFKGRFQDFDVSDVARQVQPDMDVQRIYNGRFSVNSLTNAIQANLTITREVASARISSSSSRRQQQKQERAFGDDDIVDAIRIATARAIPIKASATAAKKKTTTFGDDDIVFDAPPPPRVTIKRVTAPAASWGDADILF